MRVLNQLRAVIANIFIGLADFFATILSPLFGHIGWTPPAWLSHVLALLRQATCAVVRQAKAKPLGAALLLGSLALASAGGWQGYRWYQNRPVPATVAYKVLPPDVTCYSCDAPYNAPNPVSITFESAVAPLDLIEKELTPAAKTIHLSPALAGSWHWASDKELVFQPSVDWPVGVEFTVDFAKKGFAHPSVLLANYQAKFSSAAFSSEVKDASFYQDPVNPNEKKAVYTIAFSHPANTEKLSERIKLAYFETSSHSEHSATAPSYSLTWDAHFLNAYLHTATLPMLAEGGRVLLTVDAGLQARVGGNVSLKPLEASVAIPARNSLSVTGLELALARDEEDNPKQIITVELNQSTAEEQLRKHLKAWRLPAKHPDAATQAQFVKEHGPDTRYSWSAEDVARLSPAQLGQALALSYNPLEEAHATLHSLGHPANAGEQLYVQVQAGLSSYGGYQMTEATGAVMTVPALPQELRLTHKGALLAMSGQKKLTLFSRDIPGIRVEIGRLLPQQLQHLVTQSRGELHKPTWNSGNNSYTEYLGADRYFDADNLTEQFTKIIELPALPPGTPHYEALDLAPYLLESTTNRRGIFLLRAQAYNPAKQQIITPVPREGSEEGDSEEGGYEAEVADTRLVVVTDLGLVLKRNSDGSNEVFVQSIASGTPVAGVSVQVVGKNGQTVMSASTDADGHAHLADYRKLEREKAAVLILASKDGDQSFLPVDSRVSDTDLSRFDTGGVSQPSAEGSLSAYLMSDRGMFRPGETAHFASIVRAAKFAAPLPQTPVIYEITDPRGQVVLTRSQPLPVSGLDTLDYSPSTAAPTGTYTLSAYLPAEHLGRERLGSLDFRVREFQPDRLKLAVTLNHSQSPGWVAPANLQANITLQNLFGTPAQNRRIKITQRISPYLPSFAGLEGYVFSDPYKPVEGLSEDLPELSTAEDGSATAPLNLERFAQGSYRIHLTVEGFEADGGRGVTAEVQQLVSSLPYLVGYKADGALQGLARNSSRNLRWLAVNPQLQALAVAEGLTLRRYEVRYLSVLTRNGNGTYQYQSRPKDVLLSEAPYSLPAAGQTLALNSKEPGQFYYQLVNASGLALARVDYQIIGAANLSRDLEKNAELQISLASKDIQPGQALQLSIVAPYTGAGLITIEREKVLSWQWFKASTTASLQTVKVPEGLEGSAYVHVMFTRDLASPEVFTSPLSYGVAPFTVAVDARRAPLSLSIPKLIKPGQTLNIQVSAASPGKAVVYAVNEGILQVARYTLPDPVAFFFQKRMLEVGTRQILDLILPEYRSLSSGAAPGGDEEGAMGRHLNPFKRKTDPPVAWWSGPIDVGPTAKILHYPVPDTFNGSLRVMAVSVNPQALGRAEALAEVRGDFTLSPNHPLAVAPGDSFEVTSGVANNLPNAPKDAKVAVSLSVSNGLKLLGPAQQTLTAGALREGLARWQVQALDAPGGQTLTFTARYQDKSAQVRGSLSLRPASPWGQWLTAATVPANGSIKLAAPLPLYPYQRQLQVSASTLPLALADGLVSYLGNYSNYCTEQLTSVAVPALLFSNRPELGQLKAAPNMLPNLYAELASRQLGDGSFSYWPGGGYSNEYVSLYALHFLLEASERKQLLPPGLLQKGSEFLTQVARRPPNNIEQAHNSAYAIYLLARLGQVVGAPADALQVQLTKLSKTWRQDIPAAWLAAAYARMQQPAQAKTLIKGVQLSGKNHYYDEWHSPMTRDAELMYVLAKHFPEDATRLAPQYLPQLAERLSDGLYSLSAATSLLALDAYSPPNGSGNFSGTQTLPGGEQALVFSGGLFAHSPLNAAASKLTVKNLSPLPAYAVVSGSGFARSPPSRAGGNGLEVQRDYLDAQGKPVSSVSIGEQVTVRLRFRSTKGTGVKNVALVDLLPGGFELVLPNAPPPEAQMASATPVAQPVEGEGEEPAEPPTEAQAPPTVCSIAWLAVNPGYCPDYADFREDRAVVYTSVSATAQQFSYQLKAISIGHYTVPPAYGEAMYNPAVAGHSAAGSIEVKAAIAH